MPPLTTPPSRPPASPWDCVGITVSLVCAVHCTLLPVFAGLLPIVGLRHFTDERVEWIVIAVTALVGVVGHTYAYVRHHRHLRPALLFGAGLGVVVVTRLDRADASIAPIVLGLGGLLASAAHWANLRLCRCCATCVQEGMPAPDVGSNREVREV